MKNVLKLLLCVNAFFLCIIHTYGQEVSIDQVQIGSNQISAASPQVQSLSGKSAQSLEDTTQVKIKLTIKDVSKLHGLQVKYGLKANQSHALMKEYMIMESHGKYYLDYQGIQYPIQDGSVEIAERIPQAALVNATPVSLTGKDKAGKEIKVYAKK